jgi:hypothetical protein
MRGEGTKKKWKAIAWIRVHGCQFSVEQASRIWSTPVATMRDWYWIADIQSPGSHHNSFSEGLANRLASAASGDFGRVLRQIRRERRAARKALGGA